MSDIRALKKQKEEIEEEFGKFTVEATTLTEQLKQNTAQINARLQQISVRQAQLQGQVQLLDSMIKEAKDNAKSKGK